MTKKKKKVDQLRSPCTLDSMHQNVCIPESGEDVAPKASAFIVARTITLVL